MSSCCCHSKWWVADHRTVIQLCCLALPRSCWALWHIQAALLALPGAPVSESYVSTPPHTFTHHGTLRHQSQVGCLPALTTQNVLPEGDNNDIPRQCTIVQRSLCQEGIGGN